VGELVDFKANGRTGNGYLAIPQSGSGPGVIVIQEWWGLVDHIKDVCDRFSGEGFVALAPDLYHGKAAKSPDEAGKLMMALRIDEAEKDLSGAAQYLLDHRATTGDKVGVIGFCMEQQLQSLGKKMEVVIYPGADHAFFNDTRPTVYNAEAAADAWRRTIDFFRKHLS
jgi:dienelactone hydrolase